MAGPSPLPLPLLPPLLRLFPASPGASCPTSSIPQTVRHWIQTSAQAAPHSLLRCPSPRPTTTLSRQGRGRCPAISRAVQDWQDQMEGENARASPRAAGCSLCGAPACGIKRRDSQFCSDAHRAEASRYRRLLAGHDGRRLRVLGRVPGAAAEANEEAVGARAGRPGERRMTFDPTAMPADPFNFDVLAALDDPQVARSARPPELRRPPADPGARRSADGWLNASGEPRRSLGLTAATRSTSTRQRAASRFHQDCPNGKHRFLRCELDAWRRGGRRWGDASRPLPDARGNCS